MAVTVKAVEKGSIAEKIGINAGDVLLKLQNEEIMDVLDYRFYQQNETLTAEFISQDGVIKEVTVQKDEFEELGLLFETYLMDEKRSCRNACIFCFIDQLPKGMRKSLYFKDDDSRLSFLFGNYITLTNITEHEIERIIKMHISPINISVHTTDPDLRVKMMRNKNAGNALGILKRFDDAGITLNCQLVLCPEINDGEALKKSLNDLMNYKNIGSVAAVPVGLTGHRDKLFPLKSFDEKSAGEVIDIIERAGEECIERFGERKMYPADEFYLLANRDIPDEDFYEDFAQLENGVGLWALLKAEAEEEIECNEDEYEGHRTVTIATGEAAYPLISHIADLCNKKWDVLDLRVKPIKNNYFGGKITVSGLVCATDIYEQLKDTALGEELLIPSCMLDSENEMFLDSIKLSELENKLNIKITPVDNDGGKLIDAILGI